MELEAISKGMPVGYLTPATGAGGGTVDSIKHGKTGAWVRIIDPTRGKFVTVRPSEVYKTPRAAQKAAA